jgi:hypothetical protein
MFLSPSELALGESYMFNEFDIEGDAEAACELADHLLASRARKPDTESQAGIVAVRPTHREQRLPKIREPERNC